MIKSNLYLDVILHFVCVCVHTECFRGHSGHPLWWQVSVGGQSTAELPTITVCVLTLQQQWLCLEAEHRKSASAVIA